MTWMGVLTTLLGALTPLFKPAGELLSKHLGSRLFAPRLALSLRATDADGCAQGEVTPWGRGGPPTYFYHLIVRNRGREPAEHVWVKLKTVSRLGQDGQWQNTLSRPLLLRHPKDGEQPSPRVIGPGGEETWNFGFLARHLHEFRLDDFESERPLNFQGVVVASQRLRVEVVAEAINARSEPLCIEIYWDGAWIENNPGLMKQHLQVRAVSQ
jgi:hypothetical protein